MFTAKTRRLPPKTHAEIFAALHANPNSTQVARRVGVSQTTVWKIAKQTGIELTAGKAARGRPRIPPATRTKIIEALKANPNARAVTREVGGGSYKTVGKIAKQTGIELTAGKAARGRPRIPPATRTKIIEALKDNLCE
jgi:tripartite-type tricarboxylate transporter receptor subunit TctC